MSPYEDTERRLPVVGCMLVGTFISVVAGAVGLFLGWLIWG